MIDSGSPPRPALWVPLLVTIGLSLAFRLTDLEFMLMDGMPDPETGRFSPKREGFTGLLYRFGPSPGLAVTVAGLVVTALAVFWMPARRFWRPALFVALSMIIGPGVIVNSIFKENFGRPRPVQVERYGGPVEYLPLWQPGPHEFGTSFPSGHASTGFFWMAGYFVFLGRRRALAYGFLAFGVGYGLLIGYARMAQGGHWPSDVLWAGVFCYFTSYGLYYALRPDRWGDAPAPEDET